PYTDKILAGRAIYLPFLQRLVTEHRPTGNDESTIIQAFKTAQSFLLPSGKLTPISIESKLATRCIRPRALKRRNGWRAPDFRRKLSTTQPLQDKCGLPNSTRRTGFRPL